MTEVHHTARIPLDLAGERVDKALARMFPDYSRARLAGWIRAGAVTVDGVRTQPRYVVHGDETVELRARLEVEVAMRPEAVDLDIRYADADILVLCKPAGMIVHPGAGHADGTLLNALLHHDPALARLPRAGIVHRLDKDTSGLMVVARSLPACTVLVDMLSRHDVERRYEAIVKGSLIAGGRVEMPVGRHPHDRVRQSVRDGNGGKRAVTHYRVRERLRAHTVIECRLETGRTHQIRVHMAHIGHGLVGDPLYGGGIRLPPGAGPELVAALRGFRRQALHAERLAFVHPVSGESMVFEAERPPDMSMLLDVLRVDAVTHADSPR